MEILNWFKFEEIRWQKGSYSNIMCITRFANNFVHILLNKNQFLLEFLKIPFNCFHVQNSGAGRLLTKEKKYIVS